MQKLPLVEGNKWAALLIISMGVIKGCSLATQDPQSHTFPTFDSGWSGYGKMPCKPSTPQSWCSFAVSSQVLSSKVYTSFNCKPANETLKSNANANSAPFRHSPFTTQKTMLNSRLQLPTSEVI